MSVFSQSASGFIDPHVQKNAASREQLRKQVQEELDAAEAKIAKLRLEIDVVIQRSEFEPKERVDGDLNSDTLNISGFTEGQHESGKT